MAALRPKIFQHPLMRAAARPPREHSPREPQNGRSAASEEPLRQNPPKNPYKAAARPLYLSFPQPPMRPLRAPPISSSPYVFFSVSENMRIFAAGNGYQTGAPRPRPRHPRRVQIIPQGFVNSKGRPSGRPFFVFTSACITSTLLFRIFLVSLLFERKRRIHPPTILSTSSLPLLYLFST